MYKRILLKISGEMFSAEDGSSFDFEKYTKVAKVISAFVKKHSVELAIVVGAGNIWRYRDTTGAGLDRVEADQLGMTATCFNAKLLENALNKVGSPAVAMSDFSVPNLLEDYHYKLANDVLSAGEICILAGGTGNPFFTTDSCAVLRALELDCEILFKATKVDGVYDSDPHKNKDAKRYSTITYSEVLAKSLEVMDLAAISLAKDASLPLLVFDFSDYENLEKVMLNESLGTKVN
jgi:uridylate kinase